MVRRTLALIAIAAAVAAVVAAPFRWNATVTRAEALDSLTGEEFEKAFLQQMIVHHAMAVEMAKPIAEKAVHDELKVVGQSIITSQSAEIQQMRGWLKDWYGIDAPTPMMDDQATMPGMHEGDGMGSGMHQGEGQGQMPAMTPGMTPAMEPGMSEGMGMMQDMARLSGPRLEAVFMAMMISHHEGAVSMARLASERAVHPELKQLAQQVIADQTREIDQLNQWLMAWYGL